LKALKASPAHQCSSKIGGKIWNKERFFGVGLFQFLACVSYENTDIWPKGTSC